MLAMIGAFLVVLSVLGSYAGMGGFIGTLWQPFEITIVLGTSLGSFILANPRHVLRETITALRSLGQPPRYDRNSYLELLSMLFAVFRIARSKGWKTLEPHIEEPESSTLFRRFPRFYKSPHAVIFFCDYIRLVSLGSSNPYEISTLMDEEIETIHAERLQVADSLQTMAEGMPALGIIAAVLGMIRAMASINQPPAVLGHLIGGALVGTFVGIVMSYGFVGPVASSLRGRIDAEMKYYFCIKAGVLAFLQGSAPQVSVEFARKVLLSEDRPTFLEVEDATLSIPSI